MKLYSYKSINDVPLECWRNFEKIPPNLSLGYFRAMESSPPIGTSYAYTLVKENNNFIGLLYFQIVDFGSENMSESEGPSFQKWFGNTVNGWIKSSMNKALDKLSYKLIVHGNTLFSGEYGFLFSKEFNLEGYNSLLNDSIIDIRKLYPNENLKVVLTKDFHEKNDCNRRFKDEKYKPFKVQPNMGLIILEHWKSFDDYKADLTSKYRVRLKKVRKQAVLLKKVEFSEEQIKIHNETLFSLYKNIADNAGFNLVKLQPNYFLALKQELKDNFKLFVYYDESGKIIGFYTHLSNKTTLEAHYLGFDYDSNSKYKLYNNMLFDILEDAITMNIKKINYGRTALEIKSTIGAVAEPLYCHIKHDSKLAQTGLCMVFDFLKTENWTPRHPFKTKPNE